MPSILTPQNQSMATTSSSSSSAGQFARLAMASKILCDRELIEARQEIESLKLQLFWKNYSVPNLQISIATTSIFSERGCDCDMCSEAQRFCTDFDVNVNNNNANEKKPCKFRQMFEAKLTELGIVYIECVGDPAFVEHPAAEGLYCGSNVLDLDAHIVIFNKDSGEPTSRYSIGLYLTLSISISPTLEPKTYKN